MIIKVAILAAIGIFAGILIALSRPAHAAECFSFEGQVDMASASGAVVFVAHWADVPALVAKAEESTGQRYSGVSRAFVAFAPGGPVVIGLEVRGCLLDPIAYRPKRPKPPGLQL